MKHEKRIKFSFLILLFFFAVIILKLFFIQIIQYSRFTTLAKKQQTRVSEISSNRGIIYDRQNRKLTDNISMESIYAIPNKIKDKKGTALTLGRILDLDSNKIIQKFNEKKHFLWIARKVDSAKVSKIKELNIDGVNFVPEIKRFYPYKNSACHVCGFAGIDNNGLEGIELYYDKYLRALNELGIFQRDALGREVFIEKQNKSPFSGSANLILNIDIVIQHIAESELKDACKKYDARGGSVVIMEPYSGAILSLVNWPSYDPNDFTESSADARKNRAVVDAFEPGSTFKIVTAAAAFEEGIAKEEDKIFCENGTYSIYNHEIHDHEKRGWLTFKEVLGYSSNIGTIKVGMKVGESKLEEYALKFGFGSLSNIDLSGEAKGIIRPVKDWSTLSLCAVPIGQEVGVTAIQLVRAYACICNGGFLVQPRVAYAITDENNKIIKKFEPKITKNIISQNTASRIGYILKDAVDYGTGKLAKIKGYEVAGKTGTAQKIDVKTHDYSDSKYIASFIGYLPFGKPKVVILVMIDEPKGDYWGGTVAAPVFKRIAEKVMRYLEIPPMAASLKTAKEISGESL